MPYKTMTEGELVALILLSRGFFYDAKTHALPDELASLVARGLIEHGPRDKLDVTAAGRTLVERLLSWAGAPDLDPVTRRRLRDGERALALPLPRTPEEAARYLAETNDGICAMQSLAELPSPEDTAQSVRDLEELGRRRAMAHKMLR